MTAEPKILFMNQRNDAVALDRDDPLALLRERFFLHDDTLYLDGNPIGVPPSWLAPCHGKLGAPHGSPGAAPSTAYRKPC